MTQDSQRQWTQSVDPHADHHSKLQYALFGATGNNGLLGTVRAHREQIAALTEWRKRIDQTLVTLRWIALIIGFLITVQTPPEFWTNLGKLLGATRAIGG